MRYQPQTATSCGIWPPSNTACWGSASQGLLVRYQRCRCPKFGHGPSDCCTGRRPPLTLREPRGETATTVRLRARLVFGAHEQPASSRSRAVIVGWPRRGGGVRDRTAVGRATAREVRVVKVLHGRVRKAEAVDGRLLRPPPRGAPPWRLRVRGSARRPPHISFGSLVLGCQSRPTRQKRFRGHNGLHYGQCSHRANREEAYRTLKGPHVSQTHTLRRRRTQPPPRSG
jgi:hypothetical protein